MSRSHSHFAPLAVATALVAGLVPACLKSSAPSAGTVVTDGAAPNVRVIWYELDENQNPEQAFVRLNVGRIPLTSAELIRAQLLRSDREQLDPRDAQQIPQDWDFIERRLQNDRY